VAGLDATGFTPKALDEINSEMASAVKAAISPTLNTSATSLLGEMFGTIASQLRQLWELGQAVHASQDPDQANGASLRAVAAITGTVSEASSKSTDLLDLNLDSGTYAAGTLVVYVVGDPTARFANKLAVVSGGGVVSGVLMEAEQAGPVRANAGTLTVIASPIAGFNSVSSDPLDAVLGHDPETDTALRLRREQELTRRGSSTVDAMRTDILQVDGVTFVAVYENVADTTDGAGRPPHSVEAVVVGGIDADVAGGIWDAKPAGIQAYGLTTVSHTDSQGVVHSIGFSRPTSIVLYIDMAVTYTAGKYAGDTIMKQTLVDYADADLSVGYDVLIAKLTAVAMSVPGVIDVYIEVGLSSGAGTFPTNFVIGPREIADFDTSRIVVVSTAGVHS
jgi:uncharacterized phage protein gp47/JayE